MEKVQKPMCRLHVLLAAKARTAVIIRRGPSKCVQLIRWDRGCDTFEHGQWLKGRVFELNSDLSPSGRYLVYNATKNKFHQDPPMWTAISKPPHFTALALWSAGLDDGGGIFESDNVLTVGYFNNEIEGKTELPKGFVVRTDFKMIALGKSNNILALRMRRDGWLLIESRTEVRGEMQIKFETPERWGKCSPGDTRALLMCDWRIVRGSPGWQFSYELKMDEGSVELGVLDWADWDVNGDLLFAHSGKIFRLKAGCTEVGEARELCDLNGAKFEEVPPARRALRW